ncbi:MAG: internal scaffolding protein [Microvirus sp.]|nr:MAG: internal scaffolding protein [Microvirus sp.]
MQLDKETGEITYTPLRTPYNYDRDAVSFVTGLRCEDPSLTQQNTKDDTDINVIMERYGVTGVLPQGARLPSYGDFEGVTDYHTAMSALRRSQEAFNALPATIRDRFDNDPQLLLEFMSDESNRAEAHELGLVQTPPSVPSEPVQKDA